MRNERSTARKLSRGGGRALAGTASAVALLTASCGNQAGEAPPPPPPLFLDVTMRDYRFVHPRSVVPRGRIVFRVRNAGRHKHELTLVGLPAGLPLTDLFRGRGHTFATLADLRDLQPGDGDTFAVELPPGRYAMLCFVKGRRGVVHAKGKGMVSELRVR